MRYIEIKNADLIVGNSRYYVKKPLINQKKWHDVFGNNNPIYLELGMGRGDFIINMAKKYPNINFIGLENNFSQMVSAVKELEHLDLSNLKLICSDAEEIGNIFFKEIDTIYLTFCDPWPLKKNEKRRFTHPIFLRLFDKVFKKHKHVILKTDNKGFFAYSLETLSQYWYSFERVSLDLHHDENPIDNVMTNYEKQYYKEGGPIYYVDAVYKD